MSRVLQKGKNRITQGYKPTHKAIDLGREHADGEPIIAHTAGKVVFCQTGHKNAKGSTGNASYGNCVRIEHEDGYSTLYAHLESVSVKLGESVKQGQTIGTMGDTGNAYGIHLHFEVRKNNSRLDPTPYLTADLPIVKKKTVDELAAEVMSGDWGNGSERKQRLTAAGYDYAAVQARVNALVKATKPVTPAKKSNTEIAKEVIAGKWGNGAERKKRLSAAGYDYKTVQGLVNKMLG